MRIIFYSHMSELGNGATESLFGIVKTLSRNHDCCVITPYQGTFNSELTRLKIQNTALPFKWSSSVVKQRDNNTVVRTLKKVKQWVTNLKFNVVHKSKHIQFVKMYQPDLIYSNTSVINMGLKVATQTQIPHIWHLREFQMFDIEPNFSYKYLAKYLNKSNRLIVNSKLLKTYYKKFISEDKIDVVYNGVQLSQKKDKAQNSSVKKNPYVFIVVGSLIARKSQIDVLKAIKEVKKINSNFQLHIVGEGHLRSQLENYIAIHNLEKEVIMHGHQTNVEKFYMNADCYVMSSEFETFGRVTVEAMLCGLPIIGRNTTYNATKEIIRNKIDGWLYTTTDELIDKMLWMIENKKTSHNMGQQAKHWATTNFTLEHSVKQIETIIEDSIHNT